MIAHWFAQVKNIIHSGFTLHPPCFLESGTNCCHLMNQQCLVLVSPSSRLCPLPFPLPFQHRPVTQINHYITPAYTPGELQFFMIPRGTHTRIPDMIPAQRPWKGGTLMQYIKQLQYDHCSYTLTTAATVFNYTGFLIEYGPSNANT